MKEPRHSEAENSRSKHHAHAIEQRYRMESFTPKAALQPDPLAVLEHRALVVQVVAAFVAPKIRIAEPLGREGMGLGLGLGGQPCQFLHGGRHGDQGHGGSAHRLDRQDAAGIREVGGHGPPAQCQGIELRLY